MNQGNDSKDAIAEAGDCGGRGILIHNESLGEEELNQDRGIAEGEDGVTEGGIACLEAFVPQELLEVAESFQGSWVKGGVIQSQQRAKAEAIGRQSQEQAASRMISQKESKEAQSIADLIRAARIHRQAQGGNPSSNRNCHAAANGANQGPN